MVYSFSMDPPCHGLFSLVAFLAKEANVMPHAVCVSWKTQLCFCGWLGRSFLLQKKGLELVAGLNGFQQETNIHILTSLYQEQRKYFFPCTINPLSAHGWWGGQKRYKHVCTLLASFLLTITNEDHWTAAAKDTDPSKSNNILLVQNIMASFKKSFYL